MAFLRIENLKLNRIKCFNKIEIVFNQGVNVISGPNGSGKSTILTAIGYALFGSSYLHGLSIKTTDLIQRGKSSGKIKLNFETHNGKYSSVLTIHENKPNYWKIYQEGLTTPITETINESKDLVKSLLGGEIDASIFINALCSRQGELTNLIDETPGIRRGQIQRILGMDKFGIASTHVAKFKKILEGELQEIESRQKFVRERLVNPKELNSELKKKTKRVKLLKKEIDELEQKYTVKKNKFLHLQDLKNSISKNERYLKDLKEKINSSKKELSSMNTKLVALKDEMNLSHVSPEYIQKLISDKTELLDNLSSELKDISIVISTYKDNKAKISTLNTSLIKSIEQNNKLINKRKKILTHRNNQLMEVERDDIISKLSMLRQKIEKGSKEIKQKEDILVQYQSSQSLLNSQIVNLENDFQENFGDDLSNYLIIKNDIIQKLDSLQIGKQALGDFHDEKNQKLMNIKAEKALIINTIKLIKDATVKHDCPVCLRKFEDFNSQKLIMHHEQRLKILEESEFKLSKTIENQYKNLRKFDLKIEETKSKRMNLDLLQSQIENLPNQKIELTTIKEKVNNIQIELIEIKQEYEGKLDTKADSLSEELEKLTEDLKILYKIDKKIAQLENDIASWKSNIQELTSFNEKIQFNDLTKREIIGGKDLADAKYFIQKLNSEVMGLVHKIYLQDKELESIIKQIKKINYENNQMFEEYDEQSFQQLSHDVDNDNNNLISLEKDQNFIEFEIIPKLKDQIKENKTFELEIEEFDRKLNKYYDIIPRTEKILNILDKTPDILINNKSTSISMYLTNMVKRMLPGRGFSRVIFKSGSEIRLFNMKTEIMIETLSGGEKTVLALAMRLALADYIAPLKFLILDEPTNHLDNERINEFMEIIDREQLFTDGYGQVLLVTHRHEFNRNAQQSINLKIEKGKRVQI